MSLNTLNLDFKWQAPMPSVECGEILSRPSFGFFVMYVFVSHLLGKVVVGNILTARSGPQVAKFRESLYLTDKNDYK